MSFLSWFFPKPPKPDMASFEVKKHIKRRVSGGYQPQQSDEPLGPPPTGGSAVMKPDNTTEIIVMALILDSSYGIFPSSDT